MRPGDKSSPGLRCQGLVRIDSISIIPTQDHPRSRQTPAAFLLVSKSKAARRQIIATLTPEWIRSATWRRFQRKPDWIKDATVKEIYSVCDCASYETLHLTRPWNLEPTGAIVHSCHRWLQRLAQPVSRECAVLSDRDCETHASCPQGSEPTGLL